MDPLWAVKAKARSNSIVPIEILSIGKRRSRSPGSCIDNVISGLHALGKNRLLQKSDMEKIAFTRELIEWYWQLGSKRTEDYIISTNGWLKKLYDTQRQLEAISEARANHRPAMGVWGPSQTGKSTLVSAYIDGGARYDKSEDSDGEGSGLHWPGGSRAFFMSPDINAPLYMNRMVLNPFNQGWDGSAVLTRFVCGSAKEGAAPYHVTDVRHPVEIKLIPAVDLLQVVARGYDTECIGPSRTGAATNWTTSEFETRLAKFKRKHPAANTKKISREAYQSLHDLCSVLADLVFAELPRYRSLMEQGEENWQAQLASLLADPVLLSSPDVVDAFAGEILWDASPVLQDYYLKMRAQLRALRDLAGGHPIFCTMEAAIILLNMAACDIYFRETPPDADSKEGVLYPIIARLGCRKEAERILIGCGEPYPQKLATTSEHFALVQGLVWELMVPLNQEHLPESPFKDFLRYSDMLDFAGVGNEAKGDVSRILVHGQSAGGNEEFSKGVPFKPLLFFSKVFKRGKTACIVSTYTKRMSVDGFNIFQNVDGFPAVNAHQLINGIESWWKYLVPEYYSKGAGRSPLPLNLGLMWWAKRLNEGVGNPKAVYPAIDPIVKELGRIGDPGVSLTFAFNYYKFPRGLVMDAIKPKTFEDVASAPEFKRQFNNSTSMESFQEMIRDRVTGGTGYFFTTIKRQLEVARANPESNRLSIIEARVGMLETGINDLLNEPKLFPPVRVVDLRREQLERFRAGLLEVLKGKPEKQLREINHTLREFLDVPYQILLTPPGDEEEITRQFISRQYRQWIDNQLARFDQWERTGHKSRPDWSLLGLTTREAFSDTLDALRASIESRLDDVATWLGRLVVQTKNANSDFRNTQLRRHLAVRMANELVSSQVDEEAFPSEDSTANRDEAVSPPIGRECQSYRAFIRPFVEGQLVAFIALQLDPVKRPDQPGDKELVVLSGRYNLRPN